MKLLFVCLGNICRSPMAAGIMRKLLDEANLDGYIVDSVGTTDWNLGSPADSRAATVCVEHGIDIGEHRARQIRHSDFEDYDVILVVDSRNEKDLNRLAPANLRHKIRRLPDPSGADRPLEVPDPYHGEMETYRRCFDMLETSLQILVSELEGAG